MNAKLAKAVRRINRSGTPTTYTQPMTYMFGVTIAPVRMEEGCRRLRIKRAKRLLKSDPQLRETLYRMRRLRVAAMKGRL